MNLEQFLTQLAEKIIDQAGEDVDPAEIEIGHIIFISSDDGFEVEVLNGDSGKRLIVGGRSKYDSSSDL